MRILILGGNLAGLLSALQLHKQGDEVTLLIHGQEAAVKPTPPMLFTDPGPWGSSDGAWATLADLFNERGDFRLGQGGVTQLTWLMRCLRHRTSLSASSQALRALALARRGKLMYDDLHTNARLLPAAEPLPQVCVYNHPQAAKAHHRRGPVWHMGSSRPALSPLSDQIQSLPALDVQWARNKPTLTSVGMLVSNPAEVVAALRNHLSQIGVRFIYDRTIDGVEHIGQHLHSVSLRGAQNHFEEVDTDLVVATSVPAAWPLLKAVGLKPDLALVKRLSLRALLPEANATPLFLQDKRRGVRLVRQRSEVWAKGPTWLGGGSGGLQASEVAQLTAEIARYFGPKCAPIGDVPLVQTSWVAPDGLPVISRTTTRNLFLNIGHHCAAAAMAFGAASVLQELIDQALNIRRPTPAFPGWTLNTSTPASNTKGHFHE